MKDLLIQIKNELKFIQALVQQMEDLENTPPFVPDEPTISKDLFDENYIDGGTL